MKRTIAFILITTATVLLAGCNSRITPGDIARPAATTGAGYVIGKNIDSDKGGMIGAGVGAATGLLWNHLDGRTERRSYAEGYEDGVKRAESEMLQRIWEAQYQEGEGSNFGPRYPHGQYEGINRTPEGDMSFPDHTTFPR